MRSRLDRGLSATLAATGALPSLYPRVARLPPSLARLPEPAERSNTIIASHDAAAAAPLHKACGAPTCNEQQLATRRMRRADGGRDRRFARRRPDVFELDAIRHSSDTVLQ